MDHRFNPPEWVRGREDENNNGSSNWGFKVVALIYLSQRYEEPYGTRFEPVPLRSRCHANEIVHLRSEFYPGIRENSLLESLSTDALSLKIPNPNVRKFHFHLRGHSRLKYLRNSITYLYNILSQLFARNKN